MANLTVALFCAISFLVCAVLADSRLKVLRPPSHRCCAPEVFQARLSQSGCASARSTNIDIGLKDVWKDDIFLAYDYPNRRWALSHKRGDPIRGDVTRVVADHMQGKRYIIRKKKCYYADEMEPSGMEKLCVPQNATYHGTFTVGHGEESMPLETWAYDTIFINHRMASKWNPESCMLVETGFHLMVAVGFDWDEGEPPCIPWKDNEAAEQARVGNCGKCFMMVPQSLKTPSSGVIGYTTLLTDVKLEIEKTEMFDVPDNCQFISNETRSELGRIESEIQHMVLLMNHDPQFAVREEAQIKRLLAFGYECVDHGKVSWCY